MKNKDLDLTENSMEDLEDSKNLDALAAIVAKGTFEAHQRALEVADEVIYVSDGKLIKKVKGKPPQVLEIITPRKVKKGQVLTIETRKA